MILILKYGYQTIALTVTGYGQGVSDGPYIEN